MDISAFIKNVNDIDWQKFDNAEYFKYRYDGINSFAQLVPPSLVALASAEYEQPQMLHGHQVYPRISGDVLNAIGNNHSGNYYPVAAAALPFIIEVALNGNNKFSQEYAIIILYDLYWFGPSILQSGLDINDRHNAYETLKKSVKSTIYARIDDFVKLAEKDSHNRLLLEYFIKGMRESIDDDYHSPL